MFKSNSDPIIEERFLQSLHCSMWESLLFLDLKKISDPHQSLDIISNFVPILLVDIYFFQYNLSPPDFYEIIAS